MGEAVAMTGHSRVLLLISIWLLAFGAWQWQGHPWEALLVIVVALVPMLLSVYVVVYSLKLKEKLHDEARGGGSAGRAEAIDVAKAAMTALAQIGAATSQSKLIDAITGLINNAAGCIGPLQPPKATSSGEPSESTGADPTQTISMQSPYE
jgi:hypothetical protein